MSASRDVAEHVTSICVGALALVAPAAAAGIAPFAVSAAVLGVIGLSLRNSCARRAGDAAVGETLAAMERAGEFRAADVAAALALLNDGAADARLSPTDLSTAARQDDFDGALALRLGGSLMAGADPAVGRVLDVAFRTSVAVLRRDDGFHRDLTQALLIDVVRASGVQLELIRDVDRKLDELRHEVGGLPAALSNLTGRSRDQMEALASRFEIERAFALPEAALREALEKKAEEYRDYRARIEAIDERTAGLGNLKAAAREAAERLDLDEVEAVLSRVDEVETEIAAETKVLRADNALLRGRVDEAYRMLSAAADGFASIGPDGPAWRRLGYAQRLFLYGRSYGGSALLAADRMLRIARPKPEPCAPFELWGKCTMWIGAIAYARASQTGGEEGLRLINEAISASKAAAILLTECERPEDWAQTQNNLGLCYYERRLWLSVVDWPSAMEDASAAFNNAMRVRTEEVYPSQWAETLNNIGLVWVTRGKYMHGFAAVLATNEAIEIFEIVEKKWIDLGNAVNFAIASNNRGSALSQEAQLVGGHEAIEGFEKAILAHSNAQSIFTKDKNPFMWADSQHNIGNAKAEIGRRLGGDEGAEKLREAVTAYSGALKYQTEVDSPGDWAAIQVNLGLAYAAISYNETCSDPCAELRRARDCFEGALRVYDAVHMPQDHIRASAFLAEVEHRLAQLCA